MKDLGTRIRFNLLRAPLRRVVRDDQRTWRGITMWVLAQHIGRAIRRTTSAERVGIMLPTSGLFPASLIAVWGEGRTAVPLNYLLSRDDLEYVARDAGLDTIITVQPMIDFVGGLPAGLEVLRLEDLSIGFPPLARARRRRPEDTAVILYTSGTSGRPKGVVLSHGNLAANVEQVRTWARFTRKDVLFGVLPQFHSFGMTVLTLMPLSVGCGVVYSARFIPNKVLSLIRKHRPTAMLGIPAMYNALRMQKDLCPDDVRSLRYLVSGGEPLSDAVYESFREKTGREICEGYGLTETAPVTNWCLPWENRRGTVGRFLPGIEHRIVSEEDGSVLGADRDGEVRLRGDNVMQGYFNLPEETAAVFDEDGFFRTGDMGRVDADGFLAITGRIKEMLIIGGENVFPREIEEVLNRHESVKDSAVIGQPDPSRGEVALAFVELVDGASFDAKAIRAFCREHLAQFKVPREIRGLEALPRNATSKIVRRQLSPETPGQL
ncbi:MAG: AMP-binding protein [Planctomycetota bacterium]|nr:AMP-binding protein [Planctomycetota bacterium]